jgi:acyl-CoA dehydrogenase
MAKMTATENAQHGRHRPRGAAVRRSRRARGREIVERLYREIRALRIYEGATEVQKLIIGRRSFRRWWRAAWSPVPSAPEA